MDNITTQNNLAIRITRWMEDERNGNPFPICLDEGWKIAGYSRKDAAKRRLFALKDSGRFTQTTLVHNGKGRPSERVYLSIEGFFFLVLASHNDQSKELIVRILNCLMESHMTSPFSSNWRGGEDRSGFVYLVSQAASDYYKIGKSKNPYRRKTTLQTGSPLELGIEARVFSLDCLELERQLHLYFSEHWVRGEWFQLTQSLVSSFVSIAMMLDDQIEQTPLLDGGDRQMWIGE